MDYNVLNNISYGMYIISTKIDGRKVGCFVNTVSQITSENPIISVSINKNNYTNEAFKKSNEFSISILSENTSTNVIGDFGFYSSRQKNKFENIKNYEIGGIPIVDENMCGYIICDVIKIVDAETHDIFIARVRETIKADENTPMTYKYYHEVIKGIAPKTAPTYLKNQVEYKVPSKKYKCTICGYIYDDEKEKIKFEDLTDDWICPICGADKSVFEKIQ